MQHDQRREHAHPVQRPPFVRRDDRAAAPQQPVPGLVDPRDPRALKRPADCRQRCDAQRQQRLPVPPPERLEGDQCRRQDARSRHDRVDDSGAQQQRSAGRARPGQAGQQPARGQRLGERARGQKGFGNPQDEIAAVERRQREHHGSRWHEDAGGHNPGDPRDGHAEPQQLRRRPPQPRCAGQSEGIDRHPIGSPEDGVIVLRSVGEEQVAPKHFRQVMQHRLGRVQDPVVMDAGPRMGEGPEARECEPRARPDRPGRPRRSDIPLQVRHCKQEPSSTGGAIRRAADYRSSGGPTQREPAKTGPRRCARYNRRAAHPLRIRTASSGPASAGPAGCKAAGTASCH